MTTFKRLLALLSKLDAIPADLRDCVLDSSSRWSELVAKAIVEDVRGAEGVLTKHNAIATDVVVDGMRISCKRVGSPGSFADCKITADGLVDSVFIAYLGDSAPRYFLVPWAAFKAASHGPHVVGEYQAYKHTTAGYSFAVLGKRIPMTFAEFEIKVPIVVPFRKAKVIEIGT